MATAIMRYAKLWYDELWCGEVRLAGVSFGETWAANAASCGFQQAAWRCESIAVCRAMVKRDEASRGQAR